MNERTTLEIIAPTVEEALAQGLSQLGLPADAVSVEVVDAGTKGLFGLGGRQVRVRLTVHGPDGAPPVVAESVPAPKAEPKPAPVKKEKPKAAAAPVALAVAPAVVPEPPAAEAHDALLDTTEAIVSKLLNLLRLKGQVSAHYMDDSTDDRRSIHVDVRGEDLSALIGRHAETLNAFQYVASLMVGKAAQQWVQLVVDVEGFRSRRERQLKQLANRMADQVMKTGKRGALEPMPSSERRIIHLELRGHPGVTTESTGDEPHRKVVVVPKE
jgi:spoIIIJ-associated protein